MKLDSDTVHRGIDTAFQRLQDQEELQGDHSGTMTLQGERFNVMGSEYFMAGIYRTLTDIYGDGAGGILRNTGTVYGEDLLAFVPNGDDPHDTFGRFLGLLTFLGYSAPAVDAQHITIPSSPTAEAYNSEGYEARNTCYFLAGMLTGAINTVFTDHDIRITEDACLANGHDHCRFILEERA